MPDKFRITSNRILSPTWIIAFFILLSSAVLILHIPEKITAVLGLCFFFLLAVFHPINGINFMLLSIPFFLGAAHNPYFSLFEILIYGTLIFGFFHLWKEKRPIEIPFKPLVLLLLLASLFSIPINAKEYYWEFWATPVKDIWFQWMRGHEKFPLIHLRALSNLISDILIFILVTNLFSQNTQDDWRKLLKSMIWMASLICVFGILFLFKIIPFQAKSFLSLSLAGTHEGAISSLAYNRQYLAQYLLLIFPQIFYFLYCYRRNLLRFFLYCLVLGLFIFSLSASMQRSAYLVFFGEVFLLLGFMSIFILKEKRTALFFFLLPFLLLAFMFLVDFLFLQKRFISRFLLLGFSDPDQRRIHLWSTAWIMFQHSPFLGVGLGKFLEFFPEFFADPQNSWKTFGLFRGEAHSFFFQTLAEQGAFGLILILSLVVAVIVQTMKKESKNPVTEHKWLGGVLSVSLISWFLLGFFHNMSYVRSLGIFFWILLGCLAALGPLYNGSESTKLKTRLFLVAVLILTAAFGYQIKLIYERPITPFFKTGVYDTETLPGGQKIRWVGGRAVLNTEIPRGQKIIFVSAPLPGIEKHPQKVRFFLEKKVSEIILRDPGWHRLSLRAEHPSMGRMLLKIETGYTFNPRKAKVSNDDRNLGIMIQED